MHHANYSTPQLQQSWVRCPLQPLQPFQKTQLQPPLGPAMDSLCHPSFRATNLSYRYPILTLPPPPCAVLRVPVITITTTTTIINITIITNIVITIKGIILLLPSHSLVSLAGIFHYLVHLVGFPGFSCQAWPDACFVLDVHSCIELHEGIA